MTEVRWADGALRDLEAIRVYISVDSLSAAERVAGALIAAADNLTILPERGRPIRGKMRELTQIRPYIVRYRYDPLRDAVDILAIWHGARLKP